MLVFVCLFYHASSIQYIYQEQEYFFHHLSGFVSLIPLIINSFWGDFMVATYGIVHQLWAILTYTFTLICFLQFKQLNQYLTNTHQLSSYKLSRFTHYHTQMLLQIFAFNNFFGQLLLAFILTNFPINTYLVIGLFLGHFKRIGSKLVFANFIAMQYTLILCFHLIAAAYSNRIHRCAKVLYHFNANQRSDLSFNQKIAKFRIKLVLYAEKFHVSQKYAISYGSFGTVSFNSFFKVCFKNGKLLFKYFIL